MKILDYLPLLINDPSLRVRSTPFGRQLTPRYPRTTLLDYHYCMINPEYLFCAWKMNEDFIFLYM